MSRYFLFPFQSSCLVLVVTFTLGLLICVKARFMGIPAGLLFISWFFKYCFVMLDAVIAGAEQPPVLDSDMVNPVSEQRPLAQAGLITLGVMLTMWVSRRGGDSWAYLCGGVLVFVLPASIAVMGVTRNPFLAAWPPELIRMIHGMRWHYLILVTMMIAAVLAVRWAIVFEMPLWLWIAATQMLFLTTFVLVGGTVHEHRFVLGVDTLTRQEREVARVKREHASDRARMLDRAYEKFNVRKPLEGWSEIQKWLAAHADDDLFSEYHAVLKAASAWPDGRPADRLASELIAALLVRSRTGEALEVLEARLAMNSKFRPAQQAHTLRLAELAGLAGKRALRRQLDPDFQERA